MNIEVVEERDNDVLVLLPADRLDSTNARTFESIVMDHISKGEQRMIVDFSRLNFISSSGLRVPWCITLDDSKGISRLRFWAKKQQSQWNQ